MKNLLLIAFLMLSLNVFSQSTDDLVFDKITKDAVWEYKYGTSSNNRGTISFKFNEKSEISYSIITVRYNGYGSGFDCWILDFHTSPYQEIDLTNVDQYKLQTIFYLEKNKYDENKIKEQEDYKRNILK